MIRKPDAYEAAPLSPALRKEKTRQMAAIQAYREGVIAGANDQFDGRWFDPKRGPAWVAGYRIAERSAGNSTPEGKA